MSSPAARAHRPPLCRRGWHAELDRSGITYVRYLGRLRDRHGTFVYLVGPAPRERACVRMWAYEDKGVAWTCGLCGRPIVGLEGGGPSGDRPKRSGEPDRAA